jgi:hypothetical protein
MSTLSPREIERRHRQRAESRRQFEEERRNRPHKQRLLYPALSKEYVQPLAVRVKVARQMLGNMGHRKFWELAAHGEFEVIGHEKLRLVTVVSLEDYIARQPRAPYSRKPELKDSAA